MIVVIGAGEARPHYLPPTWVKFPRPCTNSQSPLASPPRRGEGPDHPATSDHWSTWGRGEVARRGRRPHPAPPFTAAWGDGARAFPECYKGNRLSPGRQPGLNPTGFPCATGAMGNGSHLALKGATAAQTDVGVRFTVLMICLMPWAPHRQRAAFRTQVQRVPISIHAPCVEPGHSPLSTTQVTDGYRPPWKIPPDAHSPTPQTWRGPGIFCSFVTTQPA